MKKILVFVIATLITTAANVVVCVAQVVSDSAQTVNDVIDFIVKITPTPWISWIVAIVVVLGLAWELIIRVKPTLKDYTIIGNVLKWLTALSDKFNAGKISRAEKK